MNSADEITSIFDLSSECQEILETCAEMAISTKLGNFEPLKVKALALDEELVKLQHVELLAPVRSDLRGLAHQLSDEEREIQLLEKAIAEAKALRPAPAALAAQKANLETKLAKLDQKMQAVTDHGVDLDELMEKIKIVENLKK